MNHTEYMLKTAIVLLVVYGFYRLALRPLTFYGWNRRYLLTGALASGVLPLVNISAWPGWQPRRVTLAYDLLQPIPAHWTAAAAASPWPADVVLPAIVLGGSLVLMGWRLIQLASLRRMHHRARPLYRTPDCSVYHTDSSSGAFSLGRAIYVNTNRYSDDELKRIVEHEMVHVRQHHTGDLLIMELLCLVNWYNPLAWLIRRAVRQNLEFIADRQAVSAAPDKKAYQYLLLKAMGVPRYFLTNPFNLDDIKKRIAMINTPSSHRLQRARFLFLLPLLAATLFAFRHEPVPTLIINRFMPAQQTPALADTVPATSDTLQVTLRNSSLNAKGYNVMTIIVKNQPLVLVQDARGKFVQTRTLEDWRKNHQSLEARFGALPTNTNAEVALQAASNGQPVLLMNSARGSANLIGVKSSNDVEPAAKNDTLQLYNVNRQPETNEPAEKNDTLQFNELTFHDASSNLIHVTINRPKNSMLFVVDGKEQDAGFNVQSLAPETVESVSVWKDQDAAKKYGNRGKNGVVEITLKKAGTQAKLYPKTEPAK